jgi:outer membrane protein assembly factor BamB
VNGLVVVASTAGKLYVLDGLTGKQMWSGSLSAGVTTSMAAGQGTIVVPNGNAVTAFLPQ